MSTQLREEIIPTATIAIFSPNMRRVFVTVNEKLDGIVPLGGKFDPQKDLHIYDTAFREVKEEGRILLFPGAGVFLGKDGKLDNNQPIIQESSFVFPDGKKGHDSLFFFRLHQMPKFDLPEKTFFIHKDEYKKDSFTFQGRPYEFRALDVRERVLEIMR
ncbi:hypothetical protein KA071_00715 [Candidatus Gracilibacteria bacterium]|jgi:hypothetical protein|nr:hypothetical protein [Candidatus Gracilibacteria bacterium]